MVEYSISHTQVAFCIFKINRVHFMGHGGRTYFTFPGFLSEIFQHDICPYIPAEINQDIINAGNAVELGCQVIVMFNLCGDRKSTRLNSSHVKKSYAVFCMKKKTSIQS